MEEVTVCIRVPPYTHPGSVLPLSVLFGASFLIVVDLMARTLVAPGEIPIGVITALVGAPFFVVVLRRSAKAAG